MYDVENCPGGPENGFPPAEGTDNRRPGSLAPPHDTGLEEGAVGDCRADPKRLGLSVAVENVAEVGVVAPFESPLYSMIEGPGLPISGGL